MPRLQLTPEERQRRADAMRETQKKAQAKKKAEKLALLQQSTVDANEAQEPVAEQSAAVDQPIKPTKKSKKPPRKGSNYFDGRQQKLQIFGADPDWAYHIFNNDPGRIETALASDWIFVERGEVTVMEDQNYGGMEHSVSGHIEFQVKRTGNQDAARGILMKKWKEYFEEDQKKMQDRIDQSEREMIRQNGSDAGRIANSYVPGPSGRVNKALTISSGLHGKTS